MSTIRPLGAILTDGRATGSGPCLVRPPLQLACTRVRKGEVEDAVGHLSVWVDDSQREPTVVIEGDVDLESAPQVQSCLDRMLQAGAGTIVFNMERVGFVDSSGLHVFVDLIRDGVDVVIQQPSEQTLKLLELVNLADRVKVETDSPLG
jgi:anti-sigma B factor antagonist